MFMGNPLKRGDSKRCAPWAAFTFREERQSSLKQPVKGSESQENRNSTEPFLKD
jgi:hypothetical protein